MKNHGNPDTNQSADPGTMKMRNESGANPVSLARRIAAMIYDAFAVLALLFFCTLPIVIALQGQAIAAENPFYFAYLLVCAYFYFGVSWTRGGQTLGMRAWKIKVIKNVAAEDTDLSALDALKRFVFAGLSWLCLGLGFLWALINQDGLTWHDKLSQTRLVRSPTD